MFQWRGRNGYVIKRGSTPGTIFYMAEKMNEYEYPPLIMHIGTCMKKNNLISEKVLYSCEAKRLKQDRLFR